MCLFKIYGFFVQYNPKAEAQSRYAHALSLSCPLGLRVIVNQKPLNLEKKASCVLSVLLFIYGFIKWKLLKTI